MHLRPIKLYLLAIGKLLAAFLAFYVKRPSHAGPLLSGARLCESLHNSSSCRYDLYDCYSGKAGGVLSINEHVTLIRAPFAPITVE